MKNSLASLGKNFIFKPKIVISQIFLMAAIRNFYQMTILG
jgi:hypothetical protein